MSGVKLSGPLRKVLISAVSSAGKADTAHVPAEALYGLAASFSAGLLLLNLPIAMFGRGGGVMFVVVIGLVPLWAPLFSDKFGGDS